MKKRKKFWKKSGLEFELFVLDSGEKIEAVAYDALMFYGGPNKAPALWNQKENKFYEGLDEIKKYVTSHI